MAGDWIKLTHVTPDKPEVFQIADGLDIDPDAALGKLCRIWIWADQQTIDGNANVTLRALHDRYTSVSETKHDRYPRVTKSLLDRIASVTGFADAMIEAGWLIETDSGLEFPNFAEHNGQTSKARALTSKRVAKSRAIGNDSVTEVKRKCNADSVTQALPEKRRVEKSREELNNESASADSCAETQASSAPEQMTEFVFDCDGDQKTWTLPQKKFDQYVESFPSLDITAEVREARQWIRDNPSRRKTSSGMPRFLTNWLTKSQNRGGSRHGQSKPTYGAGQTAERDAGSDW